MLATVLVLAALAIAVLVLPPLWYALRPPAAPELPAPGRRVVLARGIALNVLEAGEGPAVVLVHGHPGCAYDWRLAFEELRARGRRVLAYDRAGYGRSEPRGAGPASVETNGAELLELLDALDLRDVTLVGWSYGGGTSIAAARRDASRIARIALVASVGPGIQTRAPLPGPLIYLFSGPVLSWVSRVPPIANRVRAAMTRAAFAPSAVPAWFLAQLDANFARPHTLGAFRSEGYDLVAEADLDPQRVPVPILVIHGREDRVVPFAIASELHARAAGSELRSIPDAGHMLPVTHPALLADAVCAFDAAASRRARRATSD